MTVRLVKRKDLEEPDEKQARQPSPTQLLITTQGWVQEFKARKARIEQSSGRMLRRS